MGAALDWSSRRDQTRPAGVLEQGKGTGRIPQEPGRSSVRPIHVADGTGLINGTGFLRKSSPEGSEQEERDWSGEANQ
jgi:hypothetical protein